MIEKLYEKLNVFMVDYVPSLYSAISNVVSLFLKMPIFSDWSIFVKKEFQSLTPVEVIKFPARFVRIFGTRRFAAPLVK